MKESTGELSMTVITIVAVVLISGFVGTVIWPLVSGWIEDTFNDLTAYVENVNGNYNL